MPVALSVIVTVAPATAAPCASVTVPATEPVLADCANSAVGARAAKQNNTAKSRATRLLDIQLPPGWAIATRDPSSEPTTRKALERSKYQPSTNGNRFVKRAINRNSLCSPSCKQVTKRIELNNSNGLYKLSKIDVTPTSARNMCAHRLLCAFIGLLTWRLRDLKRTYPEHTIS